ncbi:OmpW family protein [Aurantimonas sp. VKM B-3413]|nr:OmpW family protein [Aurantimonas sp. VKM B-3413]MCB8839169.1 OmpW family protein [Aurantimonas sp. VKM B-3413]
MNKLGVALQLAAAMGAALVMTSQGVRAADYELGGVPVKEAQSPWQVRLRGLGVITRDSDRVDGVAGSDLSYSDTVIPELDISYFFTDNIAAELILGTTYANVDGEGSLASLGQVGKTWILPPTLTLQYHFNDFGAFKPYVGAGVNYTIFYNQDGRAADDLDIENSFGAALQVGFDYMIDDNWGWNVDVKKIFLRPDFDVTVGGNRLHGKADLDPWLIGTGITYRF